MLNYIDVCSREVCRRSNRYYSPEQVKNELVKYNPHALFECYFLAIRDGHIGPDKPEKDVYDFLLNYLFKNNIWSFYVN